MHQLSSVNPFQCRMWAWHDRLEHMVSEDTCRDVIDSIARHGQLVPVLARSLTNDPKHEVELIYGARRLFAAQHLNIPLLVELRNVSDKEAIVAMDIENRQRLDISAYERGMSYARWLRAGHFHSQDELAASLRISGSQVSRLLKLSKLPAAVVGAFNTPTDICEGWGIELLDCLEDVRQRPLLLEKARAIAANERRPPAREIFRQLLSATAPGRKVRQRARDEVVKSAAGTPLFRIRVQTKTIAVLLPARCVSMPTLRDITAAVSAILDPPNSHDKVVDTADPVATCSSAPQGLPNQISCMQPMTLLRNVAPV